MPPATLGKRVAPHSAHSLSARLRSREYKSINPASFKRHCARQRFSGFRLIASLDTHDQSASDSRLSFLQRRSKIVEIVCARDVVFALTLSGVCAAYSGSTRLAFMNTKPDEVHGGPDLTPSSLNHSRSRGTPQPSATNTPRSATPQVIRSLFYNKASDSLITVSTYREDDFRALKCRNTAVEYIRRGQPSNGFAILESECLTWPGFVEFDDVNSKVLTYSAQDSAYRVWDMTNYELLYTLPGESVTEVKISPGIMLLIHARQGGYVPLKIVSIEDGTVLKSFNQLVHRHKKIDFIEQFNQKLLVKQDGENLNIIDVHTGSVVSVDTTEFVTPSAFIFLFENNLFLTFRQREVIVWNFKGEQVSRFDDHTLWHPETNTNNIFITTAQDYIISFCQSNSSGSVGGDREGGSGSQRQQRGTVHVSHILSGKCVAKLTENARGTTTSTSWMRVAADSEREAAGDETDVNDESQTLAPPVASSSNGDAEGLGEVSALHFSEERNELYVGNRRGMLHVWSQLPNTAHER
jgi:hypothetical protein